MIQILGGEAQRGRGSFGLAGIAIDDGRAAFRRNHAIHGVLEHQHVLPTPSASAPPLPPSPMQTTITGTARRAISRKLRAMASAWPAFLGVDAGVGAGGIEKRDHGAAELGGSCMTRRALR
jgi:hypothetical protein